jgi:hypothetical protein
MDPLTRLQEAHPTWTITREWHDTGTGPGVYVYTAERGATSISTASLLVLGLQLEARDRD